MKPPVVARVAPAPDSRAAADRIEVSLDPVAPDFTPAELRLTVAGREYDLAHPALRFDAGERKLLWDGRLDADRPALSNGQVVACSLRMGEAAWRHDWSWTMDYRLDKQAPPAPFVSYIRSDRFCRDDFERHVSTWGNFNYAQVLHAPSGGATGRGCVRIEDLNGARGNVPHPGDPLRSGALSRCGVRLPLQRGHGDHGGAITMAGVSFDGTHDGWPAFHTLDAEDAEWRHGEYNLVDAIQRTHPGGASYEVRR